MVCPMLGDRRKLEKAALNIGKCWPTTPTKLRGQEFSETLVTASASRASPTLPESMFGRKILESPVPSSSTASSLCEETPPRIGSPSVVLPLKESWKKYLPMFSFVVTLHCEGLAKTIYDRFLWSALVQFSGVELALESREEPGMKRVWTLTLRIRTPNFGMVTDLIDMLLSMNLEEASQSAICFDGWTDIRSSWKSKGAQLCCMQHESGSPQM